MFAMGGLFRSKCSFGTQRFFNCKTVHGERNLLQNLLLVVGLTLNSFQLSIDFETSNKRLAVNLERSTTPWSLLSLFTTGKISLFIFSFASKVSCFIVLSVID